MTKTCSTCFQEKDITFFHKNPKSKDVHSGKCKECTRKWQIKNKERLREYNKNFRKNHKEYFRKYDREYGLKNAERRRSNKYKSMYGISLENRDEILKSQDYKCKCCGKKLIGLNPRLVCLDHNHTTGAIRGILCHYCNTSLGLMFEDPEKIQQLKDYVYNVCGAIRY
jgi:hypothetical protein